MPQVRRRRTQWSPDVERDIGDLAARGASAAAIRAELERRYHAGRPMSSRVPIPSERAIDDRLAQLRPRDPSEPWTLADSTGHAANLILPVLAVVIEETQGRKTYVTRREATWIVRVRRARPDLLPWWVYRFARAYVGAELTQDTVARAELDTRLALAPVQAPIEPAVQRALTKLRFDRAIENGWVSATASTELWLGWVTERSREEGNDKTR